MQTKKRIYEKYINEKYIYANMKKLVFHIICCGVATGVILCAVDSAFFGSTRTALADDVFHFAYGHQSFDSGQDSLDDMCARMDALSSEYEELKREADTLQEQIDEQTALVFETQQSVIEGRNALMAAMVQEYRRGGLSGFFVEILIGSKDFCDLERNLFYLNAIVNFQSDKVAEQQKLNEHFRDLVEDLNAKKDVQDRKLIELAAARDTAQEIVRIATESAQNGQDNQALRVADLQKTADEMAKTEEVGRAVVVEEANTVDRFDAVAATTPVSSNPAPVTPGDESGQISGDGSVGWSVGVASAYGGTTDPYTPNPATTASGAICDDFSMGVAIPTSWPNYWSYFGRSVEISYNGQTVFATINDCGYMSGGSRALDLQPGVWKAFGFSSCIDWGMRSVNYRVL